MSENNYAALMMKLAPTNSESWNNIKDPGIYPIAAGHPSAPDGAAGVLFVMPPKSGATQDFISASKKRSTRTFVNGAWLPWSTSLYVGDLGLAPSLTSLSSVDLNTLNTFGFYVVRDSTNTPLDDSSVWFLSVRTWNSKSADDPFRIVQMAEGYGTSGTLKNRTFRRTYSGNAAGWSAWVEFYSESHKPTSVDVNAYNKQESDGRYAYKSITINGKPLSSNVNLTAGDVNAWNKAESDGRFIYKTGDTIKWLTVTDGLDTGNDVTVGRTLYVKGLDFIVKQGLQDPINNERQTNGMRIQGGGDLFVDLYQHERIGQHHFFGIHVAGGGSDAGWYEFRNDGSFSAGGTVGAGGNQGSKLYQDGNISGSMWGGYLKDWLFNNTISRVVRGAQSSMTMDGGIVEAPAGCYLTGGNGNEGNQVGIALYRPLQIWRSGYWQTIEG
ncbi:TPA: hypothetical protein R4193_002833 [Serratia marcescens]|uniref:pyocin knob domain-containing protein n=1 Tax=Serratia marcescens TaxID=615 RepID=UPI001C42496A|nr:pyocin knob domain-containing protein [Serratia marcescens]MDP8630518.1 pyocin knob domain-containing protein [Serratia marcescens]MDP8749350.1 pyocin knob domain-containing protein [Serratia marcescens]MDP8763657.1 pyocin knob domain-containing protein [Serratia marcescens]HBH7056210.1 hypothetical protein [Serratia marcescens]HED1520916.1 hypothetical protein [Serratia marcescens]